MDIYQKVEAAVRHPKGNSLSQIVGEVGGFAVHLDVMRAASMSEEGLPRFSVRLYTRRLEAHKQTKTDYYREVSLLGTAELIATAVRAEIQSLEFVSRVFPGGKDTVRAEAP